MARISIPPRGSKGFTLVEMSIVLIIIGIILGAVIKGKDLIRSGEQKKIYNNFIQQWQIVYQNYFDRTGWILGDANNNNNTGRDGLISPANDAFLANQLGAVGLDPPPNGPSGTPTERTYSSIDGTTYTICLRLRNNPAWGNHIQLQASTAASCAGATGLPADLAIALDNIIDGESDGTSGDFVYDTVAGNAARNTADWPRVFQVDSDTPVAPTAGAAAIIQLPF